MRRWLRYALCLSLLAPPPASFVARAAPAADDPPTIDPLLQKPYLELLQLAPTLHYSGQQFGQARRRLKSEQDRREKDLKTRQKKLTTEILLIQDSLKKLAASYALGEDEITTRRHELHCMIQDLQSQLADSRLALITGIPVEYDNL